MGDDSEEEVKEDEDEEDGGRATGGRATKDKLAEKTGRRKEIKKDLM